MSECNCVANARKKKEKDSSYEQKEKNHNAFYSYCPRTTHLRIMVTFMLGYNCQEMKVLENNTLIIFMARHTYKLYHMHKMLIINILQLLDKTSH